MTTPEPSAASPSPPAAAITGAGIFDPAAGDWRQRLSLVVEAVREMSTRSDPQEVLDAYLGRMRRLMRFDRTVAVSRRELAPPYYRITRSDLWADPLNPWKQRDQLPVLDGGLLGRLLYAGEPVLVDDLHVGPLPLEPADPAAEHLAGMRSLAAIPHFDEGVALNMVVHLRREPAAFAPELFPELVMVSSLFGRAMNNLVLTDELRAAQQSVASQYEAMRELSDTVLQQALELKRHADALEDRVRVRTAQLQERTTQLHEAHLDAIYMLAVASEAKDLDTGRHVRRIRHYTRLLAREVGLAEADAESLGYASVLHDVGKMHVPDHILKKPGPLTPAERLAMQEHTVAGERIISEQPFFAPARRVARSHHENWDGSGYPDRTAGHDIPLEARIVHLADVYDALTSPRVYKAAWSGYDAAQVIEASAGRMFDPDVVRAFASLRKREEMVVEAALRG